jgi:hypothetical protein
VFRLGSIACGNFSTTVAAVSWRYRRLPRLADGETEQQPAHHAAGRGDGEHRLVARDAGQEAVG